MSTLYYYLGKAVVWLALPALAVGLPVRLGLPYLKMRLYCYCLRAGGWAKKHERWLLSQASTS